MLRVWSSYIVGCSIRCCYVRSATVFRLRILKLEGFSQKCDICHTSNISLIHISTVVTLYVSAQALGTKRASMRVNCKRSDKIMAIMGARRGLYPYRTDMDVTEWAHEAWRRCRKLQISRATRKSVLCMLTRALIHHVSRLDNHVMNISSFSVHFVVHES